MSILIIISLFVSLAGAILSGIVANAKNRDVVGWAVAGALFPILGLIAIAGMPMALLPHVQTPKENDEHVPEISAHDEGQGNSTDDKGYASFAIAFLVLLAFIIILMVFFSARNF